jgi:hypothetical protein
MSGVEVGGDGSVEWRVFVESVRRSTVRNCSIGETGYEQGGVDETDEGGVFTVRVKMPRDSADFVDTLAEAAEAAAKHAGEPGYVVEFVLPVEPKNPGQVQVLWQSATTQSARRAPAPAARRAATPGGKRKGAKPARSTRRR